MAKQQPASLDTVARQQVIAWLRGSGVTQADLASRIGRTQMWVSRYLKGEFNADMDTLAAIAATFGHQFTQLFRFPDDPGEAALIRVYRAMRPEARPRFIALGQDVVGPPPRKRRLVNTHRMSAFASHEPTMSKE